MNLLDALLRSGYLRAIDHALALTLMRLRPDTPETVALAAALTSRAVAQGHSQLPLTCVSELLAEIAVDRELPALPERNDWLQTLRASPWVGVMAAFANEEQTIAADAVLVLETDAIALRRYWNYEIRLAAALIARLDFDKQKKYSKNVAELDTRLAQLFTDAHSAQAMAARVALTQSFLLLTGGPGTGKTTTVARILTLFIEQFKQPTAPRMLLAAPTGKAAARLAESVRESLANLLAEQRVTEDITHALPTEAKTLHRLLGWQRHSIQFKHHANNPLPADLIVVDEASMIDLPLMCKLLEAVAPETTLILIGDLDQLPSVETGNVLTAFCEVADTSDSNNAAGANTLASHRVQLIRTYRQSEHIDVSLLAALIRDGETDAALAGLAHETFRGVHWRNGSDRMLINAVLEQAVPAYRAMQLAQNVTDALAQAKQFRVLTAVREGGAGSQTLNALIANALCTSPPRDGFFPGRLIGITENSYQHNLFNGDIGIVWPDEHGELRVWFDSNTGPRAWPPAALPAHESAFALTVHKSQGSEFDRVFFALSEHGSRVISRELLYTGLTRCRQKVTLWASEAVLRDGIARKAQRWSGLAERLIRFSNLKN